ncbi:MAG: hypothetical protein HY930_00520 [Euryarchaeota archaeon]|nr:hypothetical protein [Euryarchaeota archaeon]
MFFEVSVLISASVRELDTEDEFKIEHPFYPQSKGAVNLIERGKITGVTTYTVENQASKKIEKAILDQIKIETQDIRQNREKYKTYSQLLDTIQRKFSDNIRLMDRLRIDEEGVEDILNNEVNLMYAKLLKDAETPPEKTWSESPRFRGVAIEITKSTWKRHTRTIEELQRKSIFPDPTDRRILSEAIYLRKFRFKDTRFFLVSCDNHFCGMRPPYNEIPREIERKFNIKCLLPERLFESV